MVRFVEKAFSFLLFLEYERLGYHTNTSLILLLSSSLFWQGMVKTDAFVISYAPSTYLLPLRNQLLGVQRKRKFFLSFNIITYYC